jgi:hypothetical protein
MLMRGWTFRPGQSKMGREQGICESSTQPAAFVRQGQAAFGAKSRGLKAVRLGPSHEQQGRGPPSGGNGPQACEMCASYPRGPKRTSTRGGKYG